METGEIPLDTIPGGIDLRHTLESGQSYLWHRSDGGMYRERGESPWYELAIEETWVQVRQTEDRLEWRASRDATDLLVRLLRLDDDLPAIYDAFPEDPLIEAAVERYRGMRLVRDPVFPCLISFICSAQMRVERIHGMQRALVEAYGEPVDGERRAFPTPARLARASEDELRELGLGYRAPYVRETARMVAEGTDPARAKEMTYEEARAYLTQFVGVGEKVADCVLLFSLDFLEAVPLDTWIRRAIADTYPACDRDSYAETSRAIRAQFGGTYAGYAQTYVFHYLRTGESVPS